MGLAEITGWVLIIMILFLKDRACHRPNLTEEFLHGLGIGESCLDFYFEHSRLRAAPPPEVGNDDYMILKLNNCQ